MQKIYVERRKLVDRLLNERPICEARWDAGCNRAAVDVHEIKRRSGGGKIVGGDDSDYLCVCRYCHNQIECNPQIAHDRGFRLWSWENQGDELC